MAREVDEKIVQMKFENSNFESGAKESIETLEALNRATEALGENTSGMNKLLQSLGEVNEGFSLLETIATGAIERIGEQVVELGENLVKSMTIDQVTAGWTKYDEKTRATKTIMNATGKSIEEVNGYLEKLMWFTDETSYNFTDMTSNIGKFTSAGVDLDTATNSMIGIANWAALAGQGANEASRAMYNLSQALGRGYVQWQDWMSVVNANMDTKEIKEMFIETAKAVGTLSEAGLDASGNLVTFGNFGETLREGWLTTDVLNQTLDKYAEFSNQVYDLVEASNGTLSAAEAIEQLGEAYDGVGKKAFLAGQVSKTFADALDATADAASSRWMSVFELIFGTLEQQEVFWTDVTSYMYDAFVDGMDSVVSAMTEWSEAEGSIEFLSALEMAMEGVVGIIQVWGNAWEKAFGPLTGDTIFGVARAFEYFLAAVTPTEQFLDNLSSGLAGVLSIFGMVGKYVVAVAKGFEPLLYAINGVVGGVGGLIGISGDLLNAFGQWGASEQSLALVTAVVSTAVETLLSGLQKLLGIVGLVGYSFYEAFSQLSFSWADGIQGFDKFAEVLRSDLSEIFRMIVPRNFSLGSTFEGFADILSNVASRLEGPAGSIQNVLSNLFNFLSSSLKGLDFSSLENLGTSVFEKIRSTLVTVGTAFDDATGKGATFATLLQQLMGPLGTGVRDFLDYVIGRLQGLSLGDIADVIAAINVAKIIKPFTTISEAFAGMMESVSGVMDEYKKKIKVDSFKTLAVAIGILAASLFVLSKVPLTQLAGVSGVLVALGAGLTGFMYAIDKITDSWDDDRVERFSNVIKSLIPLSATLALVTYSVKALADLDIESMTAGVLGVGVLLTELAAFVKLVDGVKVDKKALVAMSGISVAIRALVKPIKQLGALDLPSLAKGLASVGVVIAELAGFTFVAGQGTGSVLGAATGMIALAAAMRLLVPVIKKFGELPIDELGPALAKFGAALLVVTTAMIGLSAAGTAGLAGAVGLTALAASFALLIPQMALLAQFSWENLGKVILAFAGVLGAFTLAGLALVPVGPIFAAVALSLAALNASIAVILVALTALAKALPLAVAAFVAFSTLSSETVQRGVDNIGILLEGMIDTFINLKAKLKLASLTYLAAITEALVEMAPDIGNGVLIIIEEILHVLNTRLPDILEELDQLLETLSPYVEKYAEKAGEIALGFVEGFLKALWSKVTEAAQSVGEWIDKVLFGGAGAARKARMNEWYEEQNKELTGQMHNIADDAGKAFEASIKKGDKDIFGAGVDFSKSFLDGANKALDRHSPPGEVIKIIDDSIEAVVIGVKNGATKLGLSGESFASSFSDRVKEKLNSVMPQTAQSSTESFVNSVEESNAGGKAASTIAKQVKDDTSIEKAAKDKAQQVAEAFTTEFNKISSQLSAIGSKFGIAEAYLGPEDDYGQVAKQKELLELQRLQEELQVLGTKYSISWDQYQNMLANPNISNEEAQKQYADYLKIYEELAKKANEVAQKQKDLYGSYEEAEQMVMAELQDLGRAQAELMNSAQIQYSEATQEAYNNFLKASTDEQKQYYYDLWNQLKKTDAEGIFGDIIAKPLDADQIRNEVYTQLGLDPNNPIASFMSVEELINQAVSASQQTYLSAVEETYPGIIQAYEAKLADSGDDVLEFVESEVSPKFARSGVAMAESTAKGIDNSAGAVLYSGETMSKDAAAHVKSKNSDWREVGQGMMDGIIEGIEDRKAEVIEAAIQVALNALGAAKNALGIASPSKAFLAVGMFAIDGLRMGILNNKESAIGASTDVANGVLDAFDPLSDDISHILDSSMHPVIDPTVDLTGVRKAVETIDNLWSSETLSAIGDISTSEWNRRAELLDARKPRTPIVENTNNFTQNNYSPKALSDAEIYLQTKKELNWAFKGAQQ